MLYAKQKSIQRILQGWYERHGGVNLKQYYWQIFMSEVYVVGESEILGAPVVGDAVGGNGVGFGDGLCVGKCEI